MFVNSLILYQVVQICNPNADLYKKLRKSIFGRKRMNDFLDKVIQVYYNILNKGAKSHADKKLIH